MAENLRLRLELLGKVGLYKDNEFLSLKTRQPFLLATYLLNQEDWVNRDEILMLFWPEEAEAKARNKLRQLVFITRKEAFATELEVDEIALRLQVPTDLHDFKEAYAQADWQRAVTVYKGEFLEEVKVKRLVEYQGWLELERNDLHNMWRNASLHYATALAKEQNFIAAANTLKTVLDKDILAEDILELFMRYCGQAGQQKQAISYFEAYSSHLKQELNLEPLEDTLALATELRQLPEDSQSELNFQTEDSHDIEPELIPPEVTSDRSIAETSEIAKLHFTNYGTTFVGRDFELIELEKLLHRSRLINIVASGGMGKTRLVNELAKQLNTEKSSQFANGIIYIPLAALSSNDYFLEHTISTFATATGYTPKSSEDFFEIIKNKEYLFIFDNFEHLVDSSPVLNDILLHSSASVILVTSRETLNLSGEYVFELKGLNFPERQEQIESYDAIQLFIRAARRVQAQFTLQESNIEAVFRICKLLEGVPLTLEFAAVWSRLLSPEEILAELERNLDILESNAQDYPERHRSGRAVFEHSWQLLSQEEQELLKKLSVFKGGFERVAAEKIASATLRGLLGLLNKSLLRRDESGRFLRHVLVNQYSAEKLAEEPELLESVYLAHYSYYLEFAKTEKGTVQESAAIDWLNGLEVEQANLRVALDWSLKQQSQPQLITDLSKLLSPFWETRSQAREGRQWLKQALEALDTTHKTSIDYAQLLLSSAALAEQQSDFEEASAQAKEALVIFRQKENQEGMVDSLYILCSVETQYSNLPMAKAYIEESIDIAQILSSQNNAANLVLNKHRYAQALRKLGGITWIAGDYETARSHTLRCLEILRDLDDKKGISATLYSLSTNFYMSGLYEEAIAPAQESIALATELGDRWRLAYCHNTIGNAYRELGDFSTARQHHDLCLKLSEELEAKFLMTYAHEHLALLERNDQNYQEAILLMHSVLKARKTLNDKWGIASCLLRLGGLISELGYIESAVVLWGQSQRIQDDLKSPLPLPFQVSYQRDLGIVHMQMTQERFEVLWQEGYELEIDEGVVRGLEPYPTNTSTH